MGRFYRLENKLMEIIKKNNYPKIYVKLNTKGISILDKFYRDLTDIGVTRASPFLIYCNHRYWNEYFEFYEMEYDQIYKDHDSVFHEKLTENEFFNKFSKQNVKLENNLLGD